MSEIQRRIVTLFEARGAGQIRAQLGEMRSGFAGLRREAQEYNRDLSVVDRQMRALGTTARYALAGMTIFGSFQQVRTLGEFSAKLGEIQAIATGPGGIPLVDAQIDALGATLLRVSSQTAVPISELQQGVISLYSTIGQVPPNEAVDLMEVIAKTSKVSQSNIEDTTQALLGMVNAFGRGTDELDEFGDQFYRVIQLSAGMPGHIYAQQLGRLQSAAVLGGFTPEQLGGLAVGATRFGGSPAVNMRGLAQLMRTTLDPSNKASEAVLAGIGLPRARRQELGGFETLMAVLREVKTRGVQGAGRGSGRRIAGVLEENPEAGLSELGISGEGARLLADIYTRSEGRAVAAILSQLMTEEQVSGTTNRTIDEYTNMVAGLGDEVRGVNEAFDDLMDYTRINQAGNAMHNLGLDISRAFAPVLNVGARGIVGAESFAARHNEAVAYGGAGILSALAVRRLMGKRGLGLGGAMRGLGIFQGVTDTMQAAGTAERVRGDSPTNPLWVAVAYALSGSGAGGWFGRTGGPGAPMPVPGGGAPTTRRGRFGNAGRGALGIAGALTGAATAVEFYNQAVINPQQEKMKKLALLRYLQTDEGGITIPWMGTSGFKIGGDDRKMTDQERKVLRQLDHGFINESVAERRLRRLATPERLAEAGIALKGEATVHVDITQPDGTKQRKSVPFELYPSFTQPAPQTRGKQKTYRGGG